MIRKFVFTVGALSLVGLMSHAAQAQFAATRAIDNAVNLNVNQALERIQVRLMPNTPPSPATQASMDAAGGRLLVVHQGGEFEVWSLSDGRMSARQLSPDAPLMAAEFGADGALILLRQGGRLNIVKPGATRESTVVNISGSPVAMLAVHPAQPRVLALHEDGTIEIVDYQADRVINTVRSGVTKAQALAIDRSGNYAALVTSDNKMVVSDLSTGLQVSNIDLGPQATGLVFTAASFGATPDRLTLLSNTGIVLLLKGNAVTKREMCKSACVLTAARIKAAGEEIAAITNAGEQIEWRQSQRSASAPKSLALTAPANGQPGISASVVAIPFADGTVRLYRLAGSTPPITLTPTPTGWISMDAAGRFDGPSSAHDDMKWVGDNLSVTLANFEQSYLEPGLLRKWAVGASARDYLTTPPSIGDGVAVPPLAAVNATITQGKNGRKNLRVVIEAEDKGGGIGKVYLYHQGVLVSDRRIVNETKEVVDKRTRKRVEYDVQATAGVNSFGVTAENGEGILAPLFEQSVNVDQRIDKPALHLLFVGLNKYKVSRLDLDYARKDAEQLSQMVRTRASKIYDTVKLTTLYDENVERENLLKAFADLKANSNSEDTIIVYFAGHGEVLENEFYFLSHSVKYPFKASDAKQNGISFTELENLVGDLEARKIILLLDTCKSGDALKNIESIERDQRAVSVFGGRLGIHLLAGTDKGQLAAELSSLGHGLFTYAVLEGIGGKADVKPQDGLVSVKEMIDYAEHTVSEMSGQYTQTAQHPTAISRGFDFAVGRY